MMIVPLIAAWHEVIFVKSSCTLYSIYGPKHKQALQLFVSSTLSIYGWILFEPIQHPPFTVSAFTHLCLAQATLCASLVSELLLMG
jgi:hypothetical protein